MPRVWVIVVTCGPLDLIDWSFSHATRLCHFSGHNYTLRWSRVSF